MAEYIEREKAIDALTERNLVVHMDSVNDGLVASCHRSAQRIIANLPAADVRPVEWIPVTERLPKDREMVIGFTPCDGFMFVGYHVTSIYHDRDFSYWNIVTAMRSTRKMIKKVTHWMPLPEPPKEET